MRLTEDRISHLSRLVIDRLYKDDIADFPDEGQALREAKRIFAHDVRAADEVGCGCADSRTSPAYPGVAGMIPRA